MSANQPDPTNTTGEDDQLFEQPGNPRKSIFFSHKEGVYFTFSTQEIRIRACRAIMKLLLVCVLFLIYYSLWGVCDYCILIATASSCLGGFVGMGFLTPSCWAGIIASLLRGFRLGSELAHVDVHWKI